jgi:hypothetical protein
VALKAVRLALTGCLVLRFAAPALAAEPTAVEEAPVSRSTERVKEAAVKPRRSRPLSLSAYMYGHASLPDDPSRDRPRFESRIDVQGTARRSHNEAIAVFLKDTEHSIYQGGSYSRTPMGSPIVNFAPALEWGAKKVKEKFKK